MVLLILVVGSLLIFTKKEVISNKTQVSATIFPLYDIVKNVAGGEIEVTYILPPGASPHTFDPAPKEVKKIAGSHTIFSIGHGVDNWSYTLAKSAGINDVIIVDKNITLIDTVYEDEHKDEDELESDGKDPHYWLSVPNAILIASQVKDELSRILPEKSAEFELNFNNYKNRLIALDESINSEFKKLDNNKISTFHNAWAYFGRDHKIIIATTFEEFPGEEPTAEYLKEFQEKIRKSGVKVIFSEPQFSTKSLKPIADDLGVGISILDPIGGVDGRESYESLMKYNSERIIEAL